MLLRSGGVRRWCRLVEARTGRALSTGWGDLGGNKFGGKVGYQNMPGVGGKGGQGSRRGGGGSQEEKQNRLRNAIKQRRVKDVQQAIQQGADLAYMDRNDGSTPLHVAAFVGDPEVIKILSSSGANVNARDKAGKVPAEIAADPKRFKQIFEESREKSAKIGSLLDRGAQGPQKGQGMKVRKSYDQQERALPNVSKGGLLQDTAEIGNSAAQNFEEEHVDYKFVRTLPANRHKENPFHRDANGNEKTDAGGDPMFERRFVEKQHEEYGWGPDQEKTANLFYPDGEPGYSHQGPGEEQNAWPDMTDLTTLESFSHSARNATYKAALRLGLHWGKEKKWWNPAMAPYLKGVVQGRHVFDLTITIAQIRKMVRLCQSLVMDRCKILFVCNGRNEDMNTLVKIMAMRCNMPFLEVPWVNGALWDWDKLAPEYRGRGHGKANSKCKKMGKYGIEHKRSLLFRRLEAPPDFVFFVNTKFNRTMIDECNANRIPMAALCDSDVKTMHLQYVVPCNTESVPAVHFVLDMLTRGILEAQHLMESRQSVNKDGQNPWEFRAVKKEQREEEAGKLSKWLSNTNNDIYKVNPGNQKSPYDSDGFDKEEEPFYETETPANPIPTMGNGATISPRPNRMHVGKYQPFSYFRAGGGSGARVWNRQPYFPPEQRGEDKGGEASFTYPDKIPPPDVFKRRLKQQIDDEKMKAPIKKEDWPQKGANWHDFNFHSMEQHAFKTMSRPREALSDTRRGKGDSAEGAEDEAVTRHEYTKQLEAKILSKYWDVDEITRELPSIERPPLPGAKQDATQP